MKPADLLYSVPGRARRGNTEGTTRVSGPPGQRPSGLEAQGSSSFVHGFGRGGEGMRQGHSRAWSLADWHALLAHRPQGGAPSSRFR
jgi:hypothetical protein